ncbi:putative tail fibre protein [Acinetobacter phage Acj61]|uniref:Putative tail fibre protein n=1 Tax=Acinetobacter phage Acj61 TaxID=760732 RepID=E5E4L4_9CAUD|nr:tail fiber protein [Acinetobacter phage Acj61]ADG36198.1 putative tail fibre protein [Acinetobacter phage Acj61]
MALDPNIGRIKFLRTKTIGRKPTTNDIQEGELALNLTDRTIFSRSGDNIVDLGFGRGGKIEGSITATGDITSNNANFTRVYSTNYYSPNNFKFYTPNNGAQNIVAGGIGVMGEYANEGKIPGNGIYSQGQIKSDSSVTAPSFVGELTGNSATTSKLKNAVRINSVLFDGTTNITTPGYINVIADDNLTIRPSQLTPGSLGVYFASIAGLNGVADSNFADVLAINTYKDNTGGLLSGLAFPKTGLQNPIHYRTDYGSATWGTGRRLAYLDDDSTGNSATASRLNKTTRIATVQAVTWYRLGKVTIPQNGRTLAIRMYGGVGYNGLSNQSAAATVIFKTGNANPVNAGVAMDVLDGTSIPGQVGLLKLDDSNYEIFVQFGGYSTFNCVVEEEEGTTWTWQYASYATLPAGFQAGTVRVLAQTTSNVSSATRLQTPRTINGVSFNGTSDITIADNTKLPLTGGTLTGGLTAPNLTVTGSTKSTTINASGMGNYSPSEQGAYLSWNRNNGSGKTDFINNRGGGPGGFDWWNGNESSYTQVMTLDQSGVLSTIGGFNGNATTATSLQTARTINGVAFNGTANITIADSTKLPTAGGTVTGALAVNGLLTANGGFKGHYVATDNRALVPSATPKGAIGAYFTSQGGLTGAANAAYGDLLMLNSYHDTSGGNANALFFSKGGKSIFHYQASQDATSWGAASQLAYVTDNVASATKLATARTINGVSFDGTSNITIADSTKLPLTGGTITGSLNVSDTITITNVGDQAGAFKKLIQADTTTDGGYLAVGNNAADRGYVEIGTIDDADAEIYASQRTSANAVIRRAKLLDGAGNTSFPGNLSANSLGVNNTSNSSGLGVSLYDGATGGMPSYGLAFSGTATFGTHGGVVGDWATYFTMSGATNRGWIFKSGNTAGGNVASISASGVITAPQFVGNLSGNADTASNAVGVGQSWYVYTAPTREQNTLYTNTTGRTITVSISLVAMGNYTMTVDINGTAMQEHAVNTSSNNGGILYFQVPPGQTYKVYFTRASNATPFLKWAELR